MTQKKYTDHVIYSNTGYWSFADIASRLGIPLRDVKTKNMRREILILNTGLKIRS